MDINIILIKKDEQQQKVQSWIGHIMPYIARKKWVAHSAPVIKDQTRPPKMRAPIERKESILQIKSLRGYVKNFIQQI